MAHLLRLRQSSTTLVDLTDTTKYKTTTWSDTKLGLHIVGTSIDTLLDNFTTLERALEIARNNDAARRAGKNYTPVYLQHQFNGGTNLVQSEVLGGSVRAPRNFLELIGRYAVLNYEITLARRPYFEETSAQSVGSGSAGNDGTGLSLSAARGDMPAPLYVKCRSSLASQDRLIAGVKWRGTVANFVSTYEAESYAVRGSNVADVTVGATFSGSSVDGQRWTPSGATNEQRLLLWRNTTNPTDQQGEYAVWVRCRDNKANPKVRIRFRSGVYDGSNDTWGPYGDNPKYCLTANSTIELVFCGTIQIPAIDTGGTVPNGYSFELRGACDSSPSTFDVDCVYLIPNDGAGDNAGAGVATMTKVAGTGALPDLVLDANDRVPKGYLETTGGAVLSPAADVAGSPLFVPPNQAAKLFVLTMASATGAHDFTGTNTLTANATPRTRWGRGT